jgi:diguanylate cyclase (GGDEF)-like protein/PAS domain S-box-containing protein
MEPSVTLTLPSAGLRPSDYRELMSGSPLAFAVVDRLGRLVEVNRAFASLLGSTIARLSGLTAQEVTHPSELGTLAEALRLLLAGEAPSATVDTALIDESGQPVPVQAHASALTSDHGAYVLLALVDLRLHRDRLTTLAYAGTHDPLTGLFNRAGLMAKLDALIAEGRGASLVLLDVDKLETVNIGYGHGAGDRLLRHVGAFLAEVAEPDGLASRLAGDEFVVLADTTDEVALARYLAEELARLQVEVAPGVLLAATASVGSSPVRAGMTSSQVLAQADESMYDMKQRRQAELDQLNRAG